MIRTFLICAALSGLSACGFRPLYAGTSFNGDSNGMISVDEIEGRAGYLLRQNLVRELAIGLPGLEEKAVLSVTVEENLTRAALLPDGAVARSFVLAEGDYALQTASGVITGSASVQVPYAAAQSPYADVSAQIQSTQTAMDELARKIVDDLRLQVQAER